MNSFRRAQKFRNQGLSLIELLVAMAIAVTVMGGVVQVLMVSRGNFITQREMATLQENARYAVKYIQDEIRLARYNSCDAQPAISFNAVVGANTHWARKGVGIQGFDNSQPASAFPDPSVRANTDALVVRRGDKDRYLLADHFVNATLPTATFTLNRDHDMKAGDIAIVASRYCDAVGYLQVSQVGTNTLVQNSTAVAATAGVLPGNCTGRLWGSGANTHCTAGTAAVTRFREGSTVMKLVANALYVGTTADGVPALYRERLGVTGDDSDTWSEELIQGVENMQVTYGVDNAKSDGTVGSDGVADIYLVANHASMNWDRVVSARIALRMRSVYPVYNRNETYPLFMGVAGTGGADRFMRQNITTTVTLRN